MSGSDIAVSINDLAVLAAVLGGFIVAFSLVSAVIKEKLYLTEASIAIAAGAIVGPVCANFIDVGKWGDVNQITLGFTRIVIAIQVMVVGISLPKAYLKKEFVSLIIMLVPVMIWMWAISGLCVWLMVPGLTLLESLLIASCFTPTDPVLANSILQGRFAEERVPVDVRNILASESAANDGLGFPFLFLAINLIQIQPTSLAIGKWAYEICVYQILLSIAIGLVVGYLACKILEFAERRRLIDKVSLLAFPIALTLLVMGTVGIIGSDDLLACFIAGNSFNWDGWFWKETEEDHLQEVIDMLLNLAIFAFIGATMPWGAFVDAALGLNLWRLVILAILVLLFRRIPIVVALKRTIPAIATYREALFSGWFGPMGVSAIFYAMVAQEQFAPNGPNALARSLIVPVVYFVVLSSVIVHGITIPIYQLTNFARSFTRNSIELTDINIDKDVQTALSLAGIPHSPSNNTPHEPNSNKPNSRTPSVLLSSLPVTPSNGSPKSSPPASASLKETSD